MGSNWRFGPRAELSKLITLSGVHDLPQHFGCDPEGDAHSTLSYLGDIPHVLRNGSEEDRLQLASRLALAAGRSALVGCNGAWSPQTLVGRSCDLVTGHLDGRAKKRATARGTENPEEDLGLDDLLALSDDLPRIATEAPDTLYSLMSDVLAEFSAVLLDQIANDQAAVEELLSASTEVERVFEVVERHPLDADQLSASMLLDPGAAIFHLLTQTWHHADGGFHPHSVDPGAWRWIRIAGCACALATMALRGSSASDPAEFWMRARGTAVGRIASLGGSQFDEIGANEYIARLALEVAGDWLHSTLSIQSEEEALDEAGVRSSSDVVALVEIAAVALVALVAMPPEIAPE